MASDATGAHFIRLEASANVSQQYAANADRKMVASGAQDSLPS